MSEPRIFFTCPKCREESEVDPPIMVRPDADLVAYQIMENSGEHRITKADAMWIAELLGRPDVEQALFRWFSTKGD